MEKLKGKIAVISEKQLFLIVYLNSNHLGPKSLGNFLHGNSFNAVIIFSLKLMK